jgi:hypothetical protein
MADPKIKVGADMSAVEKELGKLDQAAQRVVDTLSGSSVGIDVKKAKADLEDLEQTAKAVADALKGVGDIKGGDVSKIAEKLGIAAEAGEQLEKVLAAVGQSTGFGQSVRASKQFADNIERARRAHELLTRDGIKLSGEQVKAAKAKFDEYRGSGARGTSKLKGVEFDDWLGGGYKKHSIDAGESERNRRKILESLGVKPGGAMDDMRMQFGRRGMGAIGGALGGVAGSIASGGDGFFSAVGNAGGGLIGAGAGALVGGPAGAAIGGIVGTIGSKVLGAFGAMLDQSLQRVLKDAINLTDLRHSIGATSTDFNQMRQNIREFTSDLRLTNEEASALARTFSDKVGRSMDERELASGTRLGAGFSRSFGMDPSMGVAFMGTMRRMGQEGDTRLALKISEAVTRNGVSPQMGAVLSAMQNFTESQTRISFTKANADGYASFMSSMLGGSLAGSKDVGTVSSAMGAADSAMRQGGAFGEASKAFMLGTYQRQLPGFNVFDLDYMKDQGAFGTVGQAFGKGSAAMRMAELRGDKGTMARYSRYAAKGGDRSVLSMQMQGIEQFYGSNTDELHKAIMGHFGVGAGQATALYDAYKRPGGLGGLEKQLRGAGVDMSKILPQQIGDLAQVAGMDNGQIKSQAAKLLGDSSLNLSDREKKALASQSVEEQRKAVLKITALHDTQKDEGEKIDQANKTLTRLTDDVTTRLTPAVIAIKQGIIGLLQHFMPNTAVLDAPGSTKMDPKSFTPGQKKIMDFIVEHGRKAGWSDEKINGALGEAWYESKFRNVPGPLITKGIHAGTRAVGPMQIMPKTARGWGADPSDMWGTLGTGLDQYGKLYDKYGALGAAVGWQSGEGNVGPGGMPKVNRSDGYKTNLEYARGVMADINGITNMRQTSDTVVLPGIGPVGPGHGPAQAAPTALQHSVTIRLEDPHGKPIPHTVVKTSVGAPAPAGGLIPVHGG